MILADDATAHVSEEVSSAARTAPIAILSGVLATETLGFFLLIAASFASTDIDHIVGSNLALPMGQVYLDTLGKRGMLAVWSLCVIVQWVNGVTQGVDASRVTFALARDNGLPGSRWWKQIHPRTRTPVNAVFLVMSLSAVIGVLVWSDTAFASLAGATVVGLYTSYAIPIFLRITWGHKTFKPGPFNLGRWSRPIGAIAVSWSFFAGLVLLFPQKQHIQSPNDMNYAFVIVLGVFVLSLLSWVLSARKWFQGPIPNISEEEIGKAASALADGDDESRNVDVIEEGVQEKLEGSSLDKPHASSRARNSGRHAYTLDSESICLRLIRIIVVKKTQENATGVNEDFVSSLNPEFRSTPKSRACRLILRNTLEESRSSFKDLHPAVQIDEMYHTWFHLLKAAELIFPFRNHWKALHTIGFAFSIMGVLASVSSTFFFPLVAAGHLGVTIGWLIPSLFVICVALSLAELASAMPTSAGLYYFSAKLAPPDWAPLISWITGWANVTGQVLLVCSIDFTKWVTILAPLIILEQSLMILSAQMIATGVAVGSDGRMILGPAPTFGIILALLFSHALVCPSNSRSLARLSLFTGTINVATTIAVAIALIIVPKSARTPAEEAFGLLTNNSGWDSNGWAFILSFTAAMWCLTGYDASAHISEEISGADRAAPIAILTGVLGTEVLGLLLLIGVSEYFWKEGDVGYMDLRDGEWVNGVTQGVDASRVTFAVARDNALPGSRWWKQIHPKTKTPVYAVWLVLSLSAIIGVLVWSDTALSSLAGATVVGLYTSYAIPIFFRITYGHKNFKPGPFSLGRFSRPIGAVAVAWSLFVSVVLLFPLDPRIHSSKDMNYAVVIVVGVFVLSAISWILSARKWFKGPVPNITEEVFPKPRASPTGGDTESPMEKSFDDTTGRQNTQLS
ncbi:hypothetical protein NP233_g11789 [Leucocoprinus birnbaumii]|uniref:Amino acid transporter n=1 Tax=Leucocoprinus birnbaumii TaxID=56174 RepID=A0AAD5YK22_9AGAR|nr:hypothetical protein NP233_g11789 [Leucocoprinus birnbaumii]